MSQTLDIILNELRRNEIQSALQQLKGLESAMNNAKASIHLLEQRLQHLESNDVSSVALEPTILVEKSDSESKSQESSKKKSSKAKKPVK